MESSFAFPNTTSARDIYTVSRLNREAKQRIESGFSPLWVEGEVSNFACPASGHMYFVLKDTQAQIRCALFRAQARSLKITPKDGAHVLIRARVSLYEGRGEFQLIVEHLEEAGEGALRRAFEALKARLTKEGLFDLARKRPIPRLPKRIGVITSPSGAVFHDIVTTLKRRFPAIPIRLYPVPVQGVGAAEKIAAMLAFAGTRADCDVLVLARGGGSLEDLSAFNDEIVARALVACPIPVVCGVGHEVDITIADLVADMRAPTPTAAAELLSPHQNEWLAQFVHLEARLLRQLHDLLRRLNQNIDWLAARLIHPRHRIHLLESRSQTLAQRLVHAYSQRIYALRQRNYELSARMERNSPRPRLEAAKLHNQYLSERLYQGISRCVDEYREHINQTAQTLHTLSPLATLDRGYAIVSDATTGAVLRDAQTLTIDTDIEARLSRGILTCTIRKIR